MARQYSARIENENEVANVFSTGIEASKTQGTIFLMSNGEMVQIVHAEYEDEMKEDGYFVASIFEGGHRVEA